MKIWAYVAEGDGIVATVLPGVGTTPMVTMDERNRDRMKVLAKKAAETTGSKVQLLEFEGAKVIEEFE